MSCTELTGQCSRIVDAAPLLSRALNSGDIDSELVRFTRCLPWNPKNSILTSIWLKIISFGCSILWCIGRDSD